MSDDLFRRVRKPCSSWWCRKRVQTQAYVREPRCRACRRRLKALRQQSEQNHRQAIERRMSKKITVTLAPYEYDAPMDFLREHGPSAGAQLTERSSTLAINDLRAAIHTLETAGRARAA